MLMGWKASDQEHETRIQGIRKLTKENERLKRMLALLNVPESSYLRKPSMVHLKRGRKSSQTTDLSTGKDR